MQQPDGADDSSSAPFVPAPPSSQSPVSERSRSWAATMHGSPGPTGVRVAHADSSATIASRRPRDRRAREDAEDAVLDGAATRAHGAGDRARAEEPDVERTCFERDRDRILHAPSFRRLAGKTQVFVFPADHQRTRLTHALEVAQVATSVARACGLNVALTEAIALGHDCGHGPGGHASEEAFDPFCPDGYDHATWGADVALVDLNLCTQTLDGVRNHSWSRPAPSTPEGEVVSWADRCAYSAHDLEDAAHAGVVDLADLPAQVSEICGATRGRQLQTFIDELVSSATSTGVIGMRAPVADSLAALRAFNYERIYTRPASVDQARSVVRVLRALVQFFAEHPDRVPGDEHAEADPVRGAVIYVGGMTDRYAFQSAVNLLGWDPATLPMGVGVPYGRA